MMSMLLLDLYNDVYDVIIVITSYFKGVFNRVKCRRCISSARLNDIFNALLISSFGGDTIFSFLLIVDDFFEEGERSSK